MRCGILRVVWAALLVFVWLPEAGAQTQLSDLIKKRSDPSAAMTKAVNRASLFDPDALRALDLRSLMAASEVARLARYSDFPDADLAGLKGRSNFTDAEMRLLEKQTEPDTIRMGRMERDSHPAAQLLKRDRVLDPAVIAALQRLSLMLPEDRTRLGRGIDPATSASAIRRNSINPDDAAHRLAQRSLPSADLLKLLQRRSAD